MKLQEVIDNLNRTIFDKEILADLLEISDQYANVVMARVIRINVEELTKIRDDLLKVEV